MPKPLSLRQHIYLILAPGLLYVGLFLARPLWFRPWCAVEPTPCIPEGVNFLDQISFQHHSVPADFASNLVQNGIGLFSFVFPWLFMKSTPHRALRLNLALLAGIAWNGVAIELIRALVQRPRPLVFSNPLVEGANIHQYTSFYSGHTSFVALATLTSYFISKSYIKNRPNLPLLLLGVFMAFSSLTGVLRVLGGRHFPSDTLGGFFFGSLIALGVSQVIMRRII